MTNDLFNQLKESFMYQARTFNIEELDKHADQDKTITLYHGTNTYRLNSILKDGIRPRNETGFNNWEKEEALANEDIVYLTNKWHYWYAYNSVDAVLTEKYGPEWSQHDDTRWWVTGKIVPIYLSVEVPIHYLTIDEDILYSRYIKDKINRAVKKGIDLDLAVTWEDCLAHHGTVGVRGGIRREWIKGIHILGDPKLYTSLMGDKQLYYKDVMKWFDGKGKGKLKPKELRDIEKRYQYTGYVPTDAIPEEYLVSQCYYNEEIGQMTMIAYSREEYFKQPMQLEKI